MSQRSNDSQMLMFSAEDSHAKTLAWPASARGWMESGQGYGSSFYELLNQIARESSLSRMCPVFYPAADVLSAAKWPATSGRILFGESDTLTAKELDTTLRALRVTQGDDYLKAIADVISKSSSPGWSNAGMASPGGFLMLNLTEWHSGAAVCSLSEVLETEVQPKYFLSPKACRGILRRAEKRGAELPVQLQRALERVAGQETGTESR